MARDHTAIDIEGVQNAIDIEDVQNSLECSIQNMTLQNSMMSPNSCIFKIPTILFRHNEKAYVPDAFSIGPMHHSNPGLKDTEKIKLQYLSSLITRAPTAQTSLNQFTEAIKKLEREARGCYAVPLAHFSVNEFIDMMVLDGCFIIELLRKDANEVPKDIPNDPIFDVSCMLQYLTHDLLLLENQIPWQVLDCLFTMTTVPSEKPLAELVLGCFRSKFSNTELPMVRSNESIKHMLHLLRNSLAMSFRGKTGPYKDMKSYIPSAIPSATSLAEAGIIFKKSQSSNSLDIKFSNGVLEIPRLIVVETTFVAIRNIISFEQCYSKCTSMIASYALVLDNLISNTQDLNILQEKGIIDNMVNLEEAVPFFNKLCHDTYVKEFYYLELFNNLNDHCKLKWPRWRATLVQNHFSKPWAIVSLAFAGVVLILTFLQTLYSIRKP